MIKAFVRGRWDDPSYPMTGPGLYERYRFPLRTLYDLRLGVDDHAEFTSSETADWSVEVVKDLIDTIRAKVR